MCGLWLSVGKIANPSVISIVDHRGPDGGGWIERQSLRGPVYLGHRRLAITAADSRFNQPFTKDGLVWIVFVGEIYNYRELQKDITLAGQPLCTESDTEVLLEAYRLWGTQCLNKLEGMFAFAIFDERRQIVFTARDRFGIKPLYFSQNSSSLALASEIKQILQFNGSAPQLNSKRAFDYLSLGLTDHSSETMFGDIYQLRPGEYLIADFYRDGIAKVFQWYTVPAPEAHPVKGCEAAANLRNLLCNAVSRYSKIEPKWACALSGGVDSSSIVGAFRERHPKSGGRHAITVKFDGAEEETASAIKLGAEKAFAVNFVHPTFSDVRRDLRRVIWHMDEPFCGTSSVAHWQMYAAAKQGGFKVVIGGQGADELFGGYEHMVEIRRRELEKLLAAEARGTIWSRNTPNVRPMVDNQKWLAHDRCGNWDESEIARAEDNPMNLGQHCRYLLNRRSLPLLLRYEDRCSMGHGIETRLPFLHQDIVEYAMRLGSQHKIFGQDRKHVLKNAVRGLVPSEILGRRAKRGFTAPEHKWLGGPLLSMICSGARETAQLWKFLFEITEMDELFSRAGQVEATALLSIWRIYCFGEWAKMFNLASM